MGHWGWRPLISALFLCVWVTGCSISTGAAPTLLPTRLPRVTLTLRNRQPQTATPTPSLPSTPTPVSDQVAQARLYAVRPGDTLLGIALDYDVEVEALRAANDGINPLALQVGQRIVIPPPGATIIIETPVRLALPPPVCYEIITASILCLGQVINPHNLTIEQARIRVGLLDATGAVLTDTTIGIEQAILPPGGTAPYSALFAASDYAQAQATLLLAHPTGQTGWTLLAVEGEQVENSGNRWQVTAMIHNTSALTTGPARVVLTLFDRDQQVAGFRIVSTQAGFAPGETQTIVVAGQAVGEPVSHQLHVEAYAR